MTGDRSDPPAHPGQPTLRVASGLHDGAVCIVPERPFSIGSASPADILLCDIGVAPLHLVIERDGADIRLDVRADGVTVEGQPLAAGEIVAAALPIEIGVGPVLLRCEPGTPASASASAAARTPWRMRLPRLALHASSLAVRAPRLEISAAGRHPRLPFVGVAAVLGVALLCGVLIKPTATEAIVAIHPGHRVVASADAAPSDATLRMLTQGRLAEAGLGTLHLTASSGIVELDGTLDTATMPRLHQIELWFDQSFGEHAVLMSHVTVRDDAAPVIAIEAVWNGPDPNVVVHGQKYFVGADLPDGSVIQKITASEVIVSRDGSRYAIAY